MLTSLRVMLCALLPVVVLAQSDAGLVERAKREGRVVLYTSLAPTESAPLAAAFEKQYGIKVELWRANGSTRRSVPPTKRRLVLSSRLCAWTNEPCSYGL